jgi:hypothetical protein
MSLTPTTLKLALGPFISVSTDQDDCLMYGLTDDGFVHLRSTLPAHVGVINITRWQFAEVSREIMAADAGDISPFGENSYLGLSPRAGGMYHLHDRVGIGFIVNSEELFAFYRDVRIGIIADKLQLTA